MSRTALSRLIGFWRGALVRYMTTPKISKVTPKVRTIDEQLTSFETFIDFAHQLGAPQVQAADATISSDGQKVVLFFSHSDFPDTRFGYLAEAPSGDVHEVLWLAEELATGALHRIMRDPAQPLTPQDHVSPPGRAVATS